MDLFLVLYIGAWLIAGLLVLALVLWGLWLHERSRRRSEAKRHTQLRAFWRAQIAYHKDDADHIAVLQQRVRSRDEEINELLRQREESWRSC